MPNPEVLGNSTARGRELSMDISHKSLGGRRRPVSIKGLVSVRSRGVLLGILVGGVPPGSPNPDPISNHKMSFFRPGL